MKAEEWVGRAGSGKDSVCLSSQGSVKNPRLGAEGMAQRRRMRNGVAEDQGLAPTFTSSQIPLTKAAEDLLPSSVLRGHCTHMCIPPCTHNEK